MFPLKRKEKYKIQKSFHYGSIERKTRAISQAIWIWAWASIRFGSVNCLK